MITAALAALPLISQAGQSVVNTVAQNLADIFSPQQTGSAGQNVPASANSSPTGSSTASLSSAVTSTLLSLQSAAQQLDHTVGGHHRHHGGASSNQSQTSATDALFNATDETNSAGQTGGSSQAQSAAAGYSLASALSQLSNGATTAGTPIATV